MRIDAHLHVFARPSTEFPREITPSMPAEREAPVEALLAQMAAHAIDKAVLVQTGGTSLAHHAYLQHCLRTYPDRFLGIGLIPPDAPAPADQMDRLAEDGSIIGFRLRSLGDFSRPIWEHAARQDYVLWLYLRADAARRLPQFLTAFPQVRVVINHLMVCPRADRFTWDAKGRPQIDVEMPPPTGLLGPAPDSPNVCVHLSGQYAMSKAAYPYLDLAAWHRSLLSAFGAARLLWASDFPWIVADPGYGECVEVLDHLLPDLSSTQHQLIMGETARRFLGFGD